MHNEPPTTDPSAPTDAHTQPSVALQSTFEGFLDRDMLGAPRWSTPREGAWILAGLFSEPLAGLNVVPREPTEAMLDAARDWSAGVYGKPIGNDAAIGCWQAMYAAAQADPRAAAPCDAATIAALRSAVLGLLACPAIADIASEDRDPDDIAAEQMARAVLHQTRTDARGRAP